MLPGQWGLLIIGIVCAVALAILGAFSYLAFDKERKRKQKEGRARRRELWHESLTTIPEDEPPVAEEIQEKSETLGQESALFQAPVEEKVIPPASENSKNTRNDFDFKF